MDLAIHIGYTNVVKVNNGKLANRAARQGFNNPRANTAQSNNTH
jgi:hypothetical protein